MTEDVVQEAKRKTQEIKDVLRNNESYKKIAHLEDKLDDLKKQHKTVSEQLDGIKKDYDYETAKNASQAILYQIMEIQRNP